MNNQFITQGISLTRKETKNIKGAISNTPQYLVDRCNPKCGPDHCWC